MVSKDMPSLGAPDSDSDEDSVVEDDDDTSISTPHPHHHSPVTHPPSHSPTHLIPPDPPQRAVTPPTVRPPNLIDPPPVPIPPDPPPVIDQFPLPTMPTQVDEAADDLATSAMTPQAELLRWHYRLAHRSFKILRLLVCLRIIPYHLRLVKPPKCTCCMYGNMTRQPKNVKGTANIGTIHPATYAGQCVSVDQIESHTPGFLAQIKGFITRRRYRAATVFVDHFSDLSYVHLQSSTTGADTLDAKKAFEAYARHHGVTVRHYHADNGRFAEHKWVHHCQDNGQTISYCAAYAHFQNGKAEKRIRDLQEEARKILLHAVARWPTELMCICGPMLFGTPTMSAMPSPNMTMALQHLTALPQ